MTPARTCLVAKTWLEIVQGKERRGFGDIEYIIALSRHFVPKWARNELEARKRRMIVSVSSVLVFMLGESIANWNTEGNGLVEKGIIGVMTRGEICRSESSCMRDGEISCVGGNVGGRWQYGPFTHSNRREGRIHGSRFR